MIVALARNKNATSVTDSSRHHNDTIVSGQPLSFGGNMIPHALPGMKRLGYFAQKKTYVNDKTLGGIDSNELTHFG